MGGALHHLRMLAGAHLLKNPHTQGTNHIKRQVREAGRLVEEGEENRKTGILSNGSTGFMI